MEVFTSYYAKAKNLDEKKYFFIGVSNSKPKWWNKQLLRLPEVFPAWEWVEGIKNGTLSEEKYTKKYMEALNKLDRIDIIQKIFLSAHNSSDKLDLQIRNVVLLCHETPDKFCHRHILADWIGGVKEFENVPKDNDADYETGENRIIHPSAAPERG